MTPPLEQFVKASVETSRTIFKNPEMDGSFVVFVEAKDPRMNATWAVPNVDEMQKRSLIAMIASSMGAREVSRYSVMALSWVSSHPKEKPGQPMLPPSKDPNRKEMMMVIGVDRGDNIMHLIEVIRDQKDPEVVEFGKEDDFHDTQAFGLFADLLKLMDHLKETGIPKEAVDYADEVLSQLLIHGEPLAEIREKKAAGVSMRLH